MNWSCILTLMLACFLPSAAHAQQPVPVAQELIAAVELGSESKFVAAWSPLIFRQTRFDRPWVKTDPYLIFLLLQGCTSKIEKEPDANATAAGDRVGLISWVCIGRPDARGVSASPSNVMCEDLGFELEIGEAESAKPRYLLFYQANAWSKKRCPNQPNATPPSGGRR